MKVLVVRARDRDIEALETAGAEVVAIRHELDEYPDSAARRACLALSRPAPGCRGQLRLAARRLLMVLICTHAAWRGLRTQDIDVVQANAISDLLPILALTKLTPQPHRRLLVGSSQSPASVGTGWAIRLRSIMIESLCDGFICASRTHLTQLLAHGVSPHRLAFVPNAYPSRWLAHLDAANCRARAQRGNSVLYVAQLQPRKAQDTLLRAAAIVLKRQPDCRFWLVGDAVDPEYASDLRGLARKLGIDTRVHFTGWLDSADVAGRVVAASIVAFPSRREMMPRAVIEAMAAGKPVVASAIDGVPDLIEDGKTGLLVPAGDVRGFADAICRLLDDHDLAARLGEAGREHVRHFCSPERVGHLLLAFFASLRDAQRSAGG